MQVASLTLCKELYELSGWGFKFSEGLTWWCEHEGKAWLDDDPENGNCILCPAYDSGYLLRKLPEGTELKKNIQDYERTDVKGDHRMFGWLVSYRHEENDAHASGIPKITRYVQRASTPEDAACKLLCELIRQGVVKP